jgi:hypothetical protein
MNLQEIKVNTDNNNINKISNFLHKNDSEFFAPVSELPWWIQWTINICLEKGKIIIAEKAEEIIGLLGITYGEPSKDFINIDIWYIYIIIIDKNNRKQKWLSLKLLKKLIEELKNKWIEKIRFKTDINSEYNNKLYKKVANIIWVEENNAWIICNLYETNVDRLSYFIK